jgi:uncharacterized damage-inducible protein DinB
MAKRGRTSAAAIEIAPHAIQAMHRPQAAHDLTDEETEVWFSVVNRLPADWFPDETLPLLRQYCRHAVQARRIAEWIEKATSDLNPKTKQPTLTVKDYDRLLKMQERESRALASLATKMRISQQTTYDKSRKKGTETGARKPWEG